MPELCDRTLRMRRSNGWSRCGTTLQHLFVQQDVSHRSKVQHHATPPPSMTGGSKAAGVSCGDGRGKRASCTFVEGSEWPGALGVEDWRVKRQRLAALLVAMAKPHGRVEKDGLRRSLGSTRVGGVPNVATCWANI